MNSKYRLTFLNRFWSVAGAISVRSKILGMVLGLVLLLGISITLQVRSALTTTLNQQIQEQSVSVARDVAARATDLILLNDIVSLHRLLEETKDNNLNVRYAIIQDEDGKVVAHTFGDKFPVDLLSFSQVANGAHHQTNLLQSNEGLIWDTAVPILEGQIGVARVGLTDANPRQTLRLITGQMILTTILVSLFGLTAATFLTWVLTRPILNLVNATKAVARGDFTTQATRWANDEIGDLADSFNQMTRELSRMEELRQERELLRGQLLERVITSQEEERKRIARELHDSTSQTLTSLMVGLRVLENSFPDCAIQEQAHQLRQIAAQTLDEVHTIARQLRPRLLDDMGLPAALQRLVDEFMAHHKIPIDLMIHIGDGRLPGPIETTLYRIVQEALTNIARHSQARSASVLIERRGNLIILVVEDNGVGFDLSQASLQKGLGLSGIQERAELLGGKMTIESPLGMGTSLFVEIPVMIYEGQTEYLTNREMNR